MPRHVASLLALLLTASAGNAGTEPCPGPFVREFDTIPIFDAFGPAEGAWRGGFEKVRPQLVDYEGDGDADLFVTEEDGKLRFYRNDGTPSVPDFVFVEDDWSGLHDLFFTRLVDIDGDGDQDLLVEAPPYASDVGGVPVERPGAYLYRNVGTPEFPEWERWSDRPDGYLADEAGDPIPFETTTPDFADLEGDGDPDLLFGDISGSMFLYRNVGSSTEPSFRYETSEYGTLRIKPETCSPEAPAGPAPRHGFMLFSFADIDSDGRPDLFVGDEFIDNLYYVRNAGGSPDPAFVCDTPTFFPDVFRAQYLVAAFADLDGDFDVDAVVGSGVSSSTGLWLLRNVGSPTAPAFVLEDSEFLKELDGGNYSVPTFADVDGDDDDDLYVGFPSEQRVAFFENFGTAEDPMYGLADPEFQSLPGQSWAAPAWHDVDGDDDPDFFLGVNSGAIRYFRNDGPGPVLNEVLDDPNFGDFSDRIIRQRADAQAIPAFLDVDGDADADLLVGFTSFTENASLLFFRNDGSPTAPDFTYVGGDFAGTGLVRASLAPAVGDMDADGDLDLLVGTGDGGVELLRDVSTGGPPDFRWEPGYSDLDVGRSAVPALTDLDGDGDADLVLGESGGGLNLFRNLGAGALASTFGLVEPGPDQEVGAVARFDWEPSFDPGTTLEVERYELRLSPDPSADPSQWQTVVTSQSEADVNLSIRFPRTEDLYWTVLAGEDCVTAPVPAWRHVIHGGALPPVAVDGTLTRPSPPKDFALTGVFPSPTDGDATVVLRMPAPGRARVRVHDAAGRVVAVIHDGGLSAGTTRLTWNGRNAEGRFAPPGVYLVRAESARGTATRRLVLIR